MAGGQGTRLRPLTLTRPKPMVEVLGRPVIDFVKDAMVNAGIDSVVVTTGYRGEQLANHVEQWNQTSGLTAWVNQESSPMGTAGSVRLLSNQLTNTFVVGSGDSVASFDIRKLLSAHQASGAKVTMALWEVDDPTEFGIVGLSKDHQGVLDGALREGFISQFKEKPTREEAFSNVINAGLYILEPEVLDLVPVGEKFDFSKQLFPLVLEKGWPMYAQTIDGVWFDVGHPFELIRAQHTLIEQRSKLPFPIPDGDFSDGNFVDASAKQNGTISGTVISSNCTIEKGAEITDTLLMSGCEVHSNSVLTRCILGRNVKIESNVRLDNVVIGDDVCIKNGAVFSSMRIPKTDELGSV